MEKVINWIKNNGYPTLLAIIGLVGLGGIVWFGGQIIEMATSYPLPLAACMVFGFALGTLFAFSIGIRDYRVKRFEQRQVAEKRKNALQKQIDFLVEMPDIHKDVLREMYKNGGTGDFHYAAPSISYLVKYSCIEAPEHAARYENSTFTLTPATLKLLKENEAAVFGVAKTRNFSSREDEEKTRLLKICEATIDRHEELLRLLSNDAIRLLEYFLPSGKLSSEDINFEPWMQVGLEELCVTKIVSEYLDNTSLEVCYYLDDDILRYFKENKAGLEEKVRLIESETQIEIALAKKYSVTNDDTSA